MKVLLSRKDTIKLLILSELITNRECNQRDIATKLKLTPQAISEYFRELISDGFIKTIYKGYYEVTDRGIDWLTKNLFDLHLFSEDLLKKIYSRSLIAIAIGDIKEGDGVSYWFKNGLIYCSSNGKPNAIALTSAKDGEEVLIKPTEEFKPPERGKVFILKVPDVCEGGSRKVNIETIKETIDKNPEAVVVALGVEALVACRKVGVEPIFFGAREVCVESAHHGCDVIVVCTESLIDDMLRRLIEENIAFEIKPC